MVGISHYYNNVIIMLFCRVCNRMEYFRLRNHKIYGVWKNDENNELCAALCVPIDEVQKLILFSKYSSDGTLQQRRSSERLRLHFK